jgi:hypothetical protein
MSGREGVTSLCRPLHAPQNPRPWPPHPESRGMPCGLAPTSVSTKLQTKGGTAVEAILRSASAGLEYELFVSECVEPYQFSCKIRDGMDYEGFR